MIRLASLASLKMNLINREDLYGRIAIGIIAGVVTLVFFNMDHKEVLAPFNAWNSAFNYSMIIVIFYILFLMNFISGLRREYEVSARASGSIISLQGFVAFDF